MGRQTVRIQRFESDKEHAFSLEQKVNDFIFERERYGNGIQNVKTEFYQTDKILGVLISYELRE